MGGATPRASAASERRTDAIQKAKARGEVLLSEAQARRPGSAIIDVAFRSYEQDSQVAGPILAGAVAFRVFLFVVPFVFFLVAAAGFVAEAIGHSTPEVLDDIGVTGLLAGTITDVGNQSLWTRLTVLGISGFALLSGTRSLIKVVAIVHQLVWLLPRTRTKNQAKLVGGTILAVLLSLGLVQLLSILEDLSFPAWVVGTVLYMAVPAAVWLFASWKVFRIPRYGLAGLPPWSDPGRGWCRGPARLHGRMDLPVLPEQVGGVRGHRRVAVDPALVLRDGPDPGRGARPQCSRLASDPRRADPRTTASTVSRTVPRRRTATSASTAVTGPRAPWT